MTDFDQSKYLHKIKEGLIGTKYGKWEVTGYIKSFWRICRCECGTIRTIRIDSLRNGRSEGCKKCHRGENIDMIGLKYGKWTVLEKAVRNNKVAGNVFFKCQCECGNIGIVSRVYLLRGKSKACRSCCWRKDEGVSAFNTILASYKCGAKSRGLVWGLTEKEFRCLITSNCYYTGLPPSTIRKKKTGSVIFNGIDRLDSKKGYILENCVPCNPKINRMKMGMEYSDFIEMCDLVSHNVKNSFIKHNLMVV